jgi:hypothetical protein
MKGGDIEGKNCEPLNVPCLAEYEAEQLILSLNRVLRDMQVYPATDWPLSIRAVNVLKRNELWTLWDLRQISKAKIQVLSGCGMKTMMEIFTVGRGQGVELMRWFEAVSEKYENKFGGLRKDV